MWSGWHTSSYRELTNPPNADNFSISSDKFNSLQNEVYQSEITVAANFFEHSIGLKVNFNLKSNLQLACQRCLEPMELAVDVSSSWLIPNEENLKPVKDEGEFEIVELAEFVCLLQLVEQELNLAIPLAYKHQKCPKNIASLINDEQITTHKPFAKMFNQSK